MIMNEKYIVKRLSDGKFLTAQGNWHYSTYAKKFDSEDEGVEKIKNMPEAGNIFTVIKIWVRVQHLTITGQ